MHAIDEAKVGESDRTKRAAGMLLVLGVMLPATPALGQRVSRPRGAERRTANDVKIATMALRPAA